MIESLGPVSFVIGQNLEMKTPQYPALIERRSAGARAAKVRRIWLELAAGSYHVPAATLADALFCRAQM
ncbi:MAG TPA: hypothetical protein VM865_06945 [Acidobacteriaceae bacterium]|jgi:anti-sigma28 factor (negative regulator of flagellin synthesis)|nr:hypothetical protein [Acidobacteriaceae bacterium]